MNAFKGLGHVLMETHMRFHFIMFLGACALGKILKIEPWEWIGIFLSAGLVVVAEIINSAIERLCDHLHPDLHPAIGRVKGITAGAVLFAVGIALVVGGLVFLPKIFFNT